MEPNVEISIKPKLIILNGPLGIGKSTLAKRYAEDHPVTLVLDVDNVWSMLSHWREEKSVTGPLSKEIALEMARVTLLAGHDVIVPQILQTGEFAGRLISLAESCDALFYEILLLVEKDEAIRRFILRGKSQGHPTGFRAGGIIDTSGREKKLIEMYDNMIKRAKGHPHIIRIEPVLGDVEATCRLLIKHLER